MRWQHVAAIATGAVDVVLTGLSLVHTAHGVQVVTGADTLHSAAMAVGIDMGFLASEAAVLMARNDTVRARVERYAQPTIVGTMLMSAALNAFAFASATDGYSDWRFWAASVLGCAIPALIYSLARISYVLWTDGYEPGRRAETTSKIGE
ncbi:hypothetical protein [Xanthobacter agilis]|uniref:hypothetical protein n=1 Tax=Xanthobacter agilis TaxID=47492 RepID=UPI00372A92BE